MLEVDVVFDVLLLELPDDEEDEELLNWFDDEPVDDDEEDDEVEGMVVGAVVTLKVINGV